MPNSINLCGVQLTITSPLGQPIEVLFKFGTEDISAWTWIGQIRSDPTAALPTAAFTFTNPQSNQVLVSLSAANVNTLGAGNFLYEIEQVTPTQRQMFHGRLTIVQDVAR